MLKRAIFCMYIIEVFAFMPAIHFEFAGPCSLPKKNKKTFVHPFDTDTNSFDVVVQYSMGELKASLLNSL